MRSTYFSFALILVVAWSGVLLAEDRALQDGPWRAWLSTPVGDLPFDLEIRTAESRPQAWIVNGDERIAVSETRIQPIVVFEMPSFGSKLEASQSPDGTRLDGRWRMRLGDRPFELPFHATAGSAPRFLTDVSPDRDPGEDSLPRRWAVTFEQSPDSAVVLLDTTEGGWVRGSILHMNGDSDYLDGEFRAGRLRLSRFDGSRAILVEATMQEDGTLQGWSWEAISNNKIAWSGRPDSTARLADPFALLHLKTVDLSSLVAYDTEGRPHVLSEALSSSRVLILEILGTWCPNCHEASSFLTQLRKEYGEQGLEVIGLAFEMSRDFRRNAAALRRYRELYGIDYPVLLASNGDPVSPSAVLPPVEGEYYFPTMLFIDSRGRIRATHVGFSGHATGELHEQMKARWKAVIEGLLAES